MNIWLLVTRIAVAFSVTVLICALRARPADAAVVSSIKVDVQTADVTFAGTDNDVELVLLVQRPDGSLGETRWNLDSNRNDFEEGHLDSYMLTDRLPGDSCHIVGIAIHKSPDDFDGGWKLDWFKVHVNNVELYRGDANSWLQDDNRDWWAPNFAPSPCDTGFFFGGSTPVQPPLPNCTVNTGPAEFPVPKPDADCDLIPDDSDSVFNPPDSDGDGLPDRTEDWNGNGTVDPGESDPHVPTKLSELPDADSDGLPDLFEDRNRDGVRNPSETDRNNPDSDGDGWADGPTNVRTRLFLAQVQCVNSSEDTELGDDEPFVTFNHSRWPDDDDLDGAWEMTGDTTVSPMIEAARRTRGKGPLGPWTVRVDLREDDVFDWSDDDFRVDSDHQFPESGFTEIHHLDEGWFNTVEYRLRFVSVRQPFADPHPLDAFRDDDGDGLTEQQEFQIATELTGVADPASRDIYMELDVFGEDQVPERYTKEDITTLFRRHAYAFHLDDGTFGGGQVLPYREYMNLSQADAERATHLAPSRQRVFHYAVGVNVPQDGSENINGRASRVKKDPAGSWLNGNGRTLIWKTDYLDHVSDFESIVWIHEFGHNLGLCHRPDDREATALGPGGAGICTAGNPGGQCHCGHYTVSSSSDTAMGTALGFLLTDALDREINYDAAEWGALDPRHIGKP